MEQIVLFFKLYSLCYRRQVDCWTSLYWVTYNWEENIVWTTTRCIIAFSGKQVKNWSDYVGNIICILFCKLHLSFNLFNSLAPFTRYLRCLVVLFLLGKSIVSWLYFKFSHDSSLGIRPPVGKYRRSKWIFTNWLSGCLSCYTYTLWQTCRRVKWYIHHYYAFEIRKYITAVRYKNWVLETLESSRIMRHMFQRIRLKLLSESIDYIFNVDTLKILGAFLQEMPVSIRAVPYQHYGPGLQRWWLNAGHCLLLHRGQRQPPWRSSYIRSQMLWLSPNNWGLVQSYALRYLPVGWSLTDWKHLFTCFPSVCLSSI